MDTSSDLQQPSTCDKNGNNVIVRQSTKDFIAQISSRSTSRSTTPVPGGHATINPTASEEEAIFDGEEPTPIHFSLGEGNETGNANSDDVEVIDEAVPDWLNMDLSDIYDALNPVPNKSNKKKQASWRAKVVDCEGKPINAIGVVANKLLAKLRDKGLMNNHKLNKKMQVQKNDRLAQKIEFRNIAYDGNGEENITFVRLFCLQNFVQPQTADGQYINANELETNLGARIIMLAVEPDSLNALVEIFAAPTKEARRAQIDDKQNSFSEKWDNIANNFFNAEDFQPDNLWGLFDARINNIDPRKKPTTAWTGEQLRKFFRELKTKFALVDDYYCRSGNLEAGTNIEQADMFYTHVLRIVANPRSTLNNILLFAFWAFDQKPPKFISRTQPFHNQFDSSDPNVENPTNQNVKSRKRAIVAEDNGQMLAEAVASLAPKDDETTLKMRWLAESVERQQTLKAMEKYNFQRENLEKLLKNEDLLESVRDRVKEKLNQLATDFLDKHF